MKTTSATGNESDRSVRAFTLIELSIVVFILALIMAISAPAFVRSYNTALLNETARAFATMCQLSRMQAVTHQQEAVLHIDAERQAFWVTLSRQTGDGDSGESALKTYRISPRVRLVSVERADGAATQAKYVEAVFYPNGTCDQVTVVFRGNERNGLAATLDPITGKAPAYVVK